MWRAYLDSFPPHDYKLFGPLHQEPGELVAQNFFNLVGLLDLDRHPHRVDRRLDQTTLVFCARNDYRVQ
jgi:hypothetical protein